MRWTLLVFILVAMLWAPSVGADQPLPMPMPVGPPKTPSVLPTVGPPGSSPPGIWTENWNDLGQWSRQQSGCQSVGNHTLTLTCDIALQTRYTWRSNRVLTMSGDVDGNAAPGSSTTDYWAGHVIMLASNQSDSVPWSQLVTTWHVPPYTSPNPPFNEPLIAWISNGLGQGKLSSAVPGRKYNFKQVWNPADRTVKYYINGILKTQQTVFLHDDLVLWLICVTGGDAAGEIPVCHFGPLTVKDG